MGKILLLGASGFVGKHVKNKLDDNNEDFKSLEGKDDLDIRDFDLFNEYLSKNKFEKIINCAAFVGGIAYGDEYKVELFNTNNSINKNIYEASARNNIKHIINPISNCAYPKQYDVYKEENFWNGEPDESVYSYAMAKRNQIILSNIYNEKFSIETSSLIFSNMYGPGDYFDEKRSHAVGSIIGKVKKALTKNESDVVLWGSGKPRREWLYVNDAVEAIYKSIKLDTPHIFTNIGVGKSISILELASLIKNAFGWKGNFILNENKKDGVMDKKVDPTRCQELFNWLPKTELIEGIKITIESVKDE